MSQNPVVGLPGTKADRVATRRHVLYGGEGQYLPGGAIIAGASSRDPAHTSYPHILRGGLIMGQIAATEKYAPSIIGTLQTAYDKDATDGSEVVLDVGVAAATEALRRWGATGTTELMLIGPPSAAGTVVMLAITHTGIDASAGTITVGSALANDFIAGSFLTSNDGSQYPRLIQGEEWGVRVTDPDTDTDIDVPFASALMGGNLDVAQIINYPSDTSLVAWLKRALALGVTSTGGTDTFRHGPMPFTFSDDA